jgi:DNA polymerase-1
MEQATRVYEMVDRPLVPVIAGMERRGIKVDRDRLSQLSTEFAGQIAALEGEIHAMAGTPSPSAAPSSWARFCSTGLG